MSFCHLVFFIVILSPPKARRRICLTVGFGDSSVVPPKAELPQNDTFTCSTNRTATRPVIASPSGEAICSLYQEVDCFVVQMDSSQ